MKKKLIPVNYGDYSDLVDKLGKDIRYEKIAVPSHCIDAIKTPEGLVYVCKYEERTGRWRKDKNEL